jgi:uncharacterized protein with HEPN domain
MSKRNDNLLLIDIQQAAHKITSYCSNMNFDDFMMNEMAKDAVIRNFEVIGEAAKNISAETKALNPGIAWKLMSNFRNRLIHEYFGVDFGMVWDIIQNDLPVLRSKLDDIFG